MVHHNNNQEDTSRKYEPDCFQLISREDLESLSENRTQLTYLKGETIFIQGAFAPHVLFIQAGLVKVYLRTGRSKIQNLWLAGSGNFLAFSSMFGEKIYPYSALALKDSELLMIEMESLRTLLKSNPEFSLRITSKNHGMQEHLLDIITSLSYKQMRGKLASSLLYLSSEPFHREQVFSYLSRQDIADFASISVESVIKFLKEFKEEGIISLEGKNISLTDPDRLLDISKVG
ncbi:MAG: Crp/Fnr family transcriptional regulator [Bacteroidota bacterium]